MASFWESTKVDGQDMRLYVSAPDGAGPFPAVVVIQHQATVLKVKRNDRRPSESGHARASHA